MDGIERISNGSDVVNENIVDFGFRFFLREVLLYC